MKNMVVLVDANVILDYVITREPYYQDAYKIIDMCYSGQVKGYLAFHSVSVIWYVLRKYMPDSERRLWLKKILQVLQVTGTSHESTNNVKDFKESVITAITPSDFHRLNGNLVNG